MTEILRHKKTDGLYEVLHRGATVEVGVPLADYAEVMGDAVSPAPSPSQGETGDA